MINTRPDNQRCPSCFGDSSSWWRDNSKSPNRIMMPPPSAIRNTRIKLIVLVACLMSAFVLTQCRSPLTKALDEAATNYHKRPFIPALHSRTRTMSCRLQPVTRRQVGNWSWLKRKPSALYAFPPFDPRWRASDSNTLGS